MTHAFIVELATKDDRDYFLLKDPVHSEFLKNTVPKMADVKTFDFERGVFQLSGQ